MKILPTLIASLIALSVQAQTFEEFIKNGCARYEENKYAESGNEYDNAFKLSAGNSRQYYDAACSWALAGDTVKSIAYLNLAAEAGWTNLKHIKTDKDLSSLHALHGWKGVLDKVAANLAVVEKDFDKPLKEKLEKIYVQDQTLRQLYKDAETKFGKDSDEMKYFWSLVAQQDSLNELEVVRIIEERGWVGKSLVGGQANMTLWLVVQHAPLETQEKYLPLLRASVLQGESGGSHLALLEDRILMRNGKPQTYGSQITTDEKTGEQVVYEIKDPEYVNQRRKEVGLGPIEDYVKRWGIIWTIEQKNQ
jgi:hypothetical protein